MIERIIGLCARHKWAVLAATASLCVAAWFAMRQIPIDAIPDLSDTQVILQARWDQSPDVVDEQITYPVVQALLGIPRVKAVRGYSNFGFSTVYIIFQDGTDLYWARDRVAEYLSKIQLPAGVHLEMGPDATSVGWVYQYALEGGPGSPNLGDLRSFQDFNLRYQLEAVDGVAEVASVGGFQKQLQVTVDPVKLREYNVGIMAVAQAVRDSNEEIGGRLIEFNGTEFMVRGHGWVKGPADVAEAVVQVDRKTGVPVCVKDVAKVTWGPDLRRGASELDGLGEAVGGIVIMRQGANPIQVINAVKQRLAELKPSLPKGVRVVTVYDRSNLIHRAIHTVTHELLVEMVVVSLVILVFLWHIPSTLIPVLTLPVAVLLSFLPLYYSGSSANIMSLSGIAVAIGAMVDASVVVVENSYKRLERWHAAGRKEDWRDVLVKAIQEVARPSFFSLLVIAVSFLPVFALVDQEGRLFRPLALTKTLAMLTASILAVTTVPALFLAVLKVDPFKPLKRPFNRLRNALFVGSLHSEEENPVSRFLFKVYGPVVDLVLRHPLSTLAGAVLVLALSVPVARSLGSEFMPTLDEGDLLYMPTALPGLSMTEAVRLLQTQDRIIKSFPEVAHVFGKAGRASTSTDVAPLSMMETTVELKPKDEWPVTRRWYSWMPNLIQPMFRWAWPDRMSTMQVADQMDKKLQIPGMPNSWTMPIKNRIDMLSTGIRTPVGIKVLGGNLDLIQKVGVEIEAALKNLPGTRSVFAERTAGGYFLDVDWNRRALARYGISMERAQETLAGAVGGMNVSELVLGRASYGMDVRYPRDLRTNAYALRHVLLSPPGNGVEQVPLGDVATVRRVMGPGMIREENGLLAGYVDVDVDLTKTDLGSYVAAAKRVVAAKVGLPPGISLAWSGQVENMKRADARMAWILPLTLVLVFGLILFNTGSTVRTVIILLSIPFSLVGAALLLKFLDYNVSVAVWVGLIALAGLDAETGIFMLLFMDMAYDEFHAVGRMRNLEDLRSAIHQGAVNRVRPKMMTVACAFMGLLPILFETGSGADVMKRIAAPMLGGLISSFIMELSVYPAVYYLWRGHCDGHMKSPNRWSRTFWAAVARIG